MSRQLFTPLISAPMSLTTFQHEATPLLTVKENFKINHLVYSTFTQEPNFKAFKLERILIIIDTE